jgi:DNA phosphorothioation-associated putative methyltransferase
MLGKSVKANLYQHVSLTLQIPQYHERLSHAIRFTGLTPDADFNVVKFSEDGLTVSLLDYPDFFDIAFPSARKAWTVDMQTGGVRFRSYAESLNPPILHRKELLLPEDHPRQNEFAALTQSAESLGLFDDTTRIGFKRDWEKLIAERGYRLAGHELLPLGNDESNDDEEHEPGIESAVFRHRTALSRYALSAPVQCLARYGLLNDQHDFFDYGCGRGDDVRNLTASGLIARGWDPYFAPDEDRVVADLVNLGFVINVIENHEERIDALLGAYRLTRKLLVVSVMLFNQNALRGQSYNDGIVTRRGTFQKYYTQAEIKQFIGNVLDEDPLPVGPGMFFVFRDQELEQHFLCARQRNAGAVARLRVASPRPFRLAKPDRYAEYEPALDALWTQWLTLGREPDASELTDTAPSLEGFGSLGKARRYLLAHRDNALLDAARRIRQDDLTVYFALQRFGRRKPYRHLEPGLQRDIKALFGDYATVRQAAQNLLFRIADTEALLAACQSAAEQGLGWLEPGESLQLPTRWVNRLSPLLRVYIGCASVLYGDMEQADLLKIHIHSGKLTLMKFDDFENKPLPHLIERVKIKLREQDFDLFQYGDEFIPPYLYRKSRYINEEFPHYAEQCLFDETLDALNLFNLEGYGPAPEEFDRTLSAARWQIDGFSLARSQTLPELDEPCGRYFTYRQLIECGETQAHTGLANLPRHPDSYTALYELARNILDPVIDYFGMIRLTYGFCSAELARQISGRIAPKLDQHAAHELNRLDQPNSPRLGAPVDFLVEDENMREVADWIAENTPFDRLYFYGENRPLHVSYGPERKSEYVDMVMTSAGRLMPRKRRRLNRRTD